MEIILNEGERLDDLQNGYYLIQQTKDFCYGIDAVLLSWFARVKPGEEVLDLFMVTKYYERIGDHATNIAEWVEYSITGERSNEN